MNGKILYVKTHIRNIIILHYYSTAMHERLSSIRLYLYIYVNLSILVDFSFEKNPDEYLYLYTFVLINPFFLSFDVAFLRFIICTCNNNKRFNDSKIGFHCAQLNAYCLDFVFVYSIQYTHTVFLSHRRTPNPYPSRFRHVVNFDVFISFKTWMCSLSHCRLLSWESLIFKL